MKHRNKKKKRKMLWLDLKKDISKVKNGSRTIVKNKWILHNISEYQTFQRTTKFTMADSYEMDLVKGIVILVKVDEDEMYKVLKSLQTNRFWSRDGIGWSKFLLESSFQCPYVCYFPALLRGRLHPLVTIS